MTGKRPDLAPCKREVTTTTINHEAPRAEQGTTNEEKGNSAPPKKNRFLHKRSGESEACE